MEEYCDDLRFLGKSDGRILVEQKEIKEVGRGVQKASTMDVELYIIC